MRGITRPTRGLGPFTGRQLTTIICVLAVTILFPVGAWAVSGSNVFVTDAVSGKRASVNASGQLQTHNNGTQPVSGSLTVDSTSLVFRGQNNPASTSWQPIGSGPFRLAQVTVDIWSVVPGSGDAVQLGLSSDGCSTAGVFDAVNPASAGVTQLTFGAGLPIPSGDTLCAKNLDPTNLGVALFLFSR